jgi:uncharacterized membrane protein YphA (DoxX/SURF4 family)
MRFRIATRDIPTRLATGAFILHSGIQKWKGPAEQAEAIHGMAANAYPMLKSIAPAQFLKLLAAGEIATGAALLTPFVSNAAAGTALTGFSGSLLGMYARTPAMHEPGSIWPTQAGIPVSKDVWMLGIGLGLMLSGRRRPALDG